MWTNIPNATSNVLTLTDAALTNTGYYQLFVSNSFGSNLSSTVYIDVIPLSRIPPAVGSYGALALSNGPVAFWQLNETNDPSSGFLQALDYSTNGLNATYGPLAENGFNLILSPQPNASPAFPGFATNQGALETLGASVTNSVVVVPPLNMSYPNTNIPDATICMWIFPTARPNTASGLFFWRNASGSDAAGFGFSGAQTATATSLGYNWNNAAGSWSYNSPLYPPVDSWSFVALVIQSNQATMYLNYIDPNTQLPFLSSVVHANTHTAETFSGGTTWIGGDMYNITSTTPGANRIFPGVISGVAFYQSALTSTQIQQMFGKGIGTNAFVPDINPEPPATINTYVGWTVQMSAGTSGTAPLTNQWQLGGVNLVDGNYGGVIVTGSKSNVLTINNASMNYSGLYTLTLSNSVGSAVSSQVNVSILPTEVAPAANIVGQWLAGAPSVADVSGYSPAGTHDGYDARAGGGTRFYWTNDVPQFAPAGSLSLYFNNDGLAIANSSTNDAAYTDTFDVAISNAMTVSFWAKGWPGGWNPFVSKNGDSGSPNAGWDIRNDGNNNVSPCFTMRGNGGSVSLGTAVYGNGEDMAGTSVTYGNDGNWHFYAATYDVNAGVRSLYEDANLIAQETISVPYNTARYAHVVIGGIDHSPGNSFTAFFTGLIYDVRIYDVALDPGQQAYVGETPPAPPTLTAPTFASSVIPASGGNPAKFVLSWSDGNLQSATNILGPWSIVTTTSPYTNNMTSQQMFFRVNIP